VNLWFSVRTAAIMRFIASSGVFFCGFLKAGR